MRLLEKRRRATDPGQREHLARKADQADSNSYKVLHVPRRSTTEHLLA